MPEFDQGKKEFPITDSDLPKLRNPFNPEKAAKVIEDWKLNFNCGTAVWLILLWGWKRPSSRRTENIRQAIWYLQREVKDV